MGPREADWLSRTIVITLTLCPSDGLLGNSPIVQISPAQTTTATELWFYFCPRRLRNSSVRSTGNATRFASYVS
jgi:hypothetical protein